MWWKRLHARSIQTWPSIGISTANGHMYIGRLTPTASLEGAALGDTPVPVPLPVAEPEIAPASVQPAASHTYVPVPWGRPPGNVELVALLATVRTSVWVRMMVP